MSETTLDFELKHAQFKDFAEADLKTIIGKHNRMAVGHPRCMPEDPLSVETVLTKEQKVAFPLDEHRFYRVSFDVTLYPDEGCRFRTADLVVILEPDAKRKKLPLVLALNPHQRGTKMSVKVKSGESAKVKLSPSLLKFLSAELGESSSFEVGYKKVEATLSAFGVGTREAGWKFEANESADIPLSTPSLELLVALPLEGVAKAKFRLAARIDIHSMLDRWLTELFTRDAPAEADYCFPG